MKHVVGFSGGLASAVAASLIAEKYGRENTVLLYHSTRTEPSDNDRFRHEVADFIGVPITEDSDGRDIWQVFKDEGFLGNGRNTPCSRVLKQERSLAYLRKKHESNLFENRDPATLYIGFTPDEWRRAQRTLARYASHGVKVSFPLIERSVKKEHCRAVVENCWGIRAPEMYSWADHANCVPCVKGGKTYWGLVYLNDRRAWERASDAEEYFGHRILTKYGTLKEELADCLRLASEHLKKDPRDRESIYEFPCECAA